MWYLAKTSPKHSDGLVTYLTESIEIIHEIVPNSTLLQNVLLSLVFLFRAFLPLVLSILFLSITSNIKLHYLFYLLCDSSRFLSPKKSPPNINNHCDYSLTLFPVLSVTVTW